MLILSILPSPINGGLQWTPLKFTCICTTLPTCGGLWWTPMDSGGLQWTLVDSNGLQWTPVDSSRLQWTPVIHLLVHCHSCGYITRVQWYKRGGVQYCVQGQMKGGKAREQKPPFWSLLIISYCWFIWHLGLALFQIKQIAYAGDCPEKIQQCRSPTGLED